MKHTLNVLATLLLAPLAAHSQQTAQDTVRDRLWIFTVHAGGNNRETLVGPSLEHKHYIDDYAPGGSRMTPAEGAFWLGVPNLLLIRTGDNPPLPSAQPWLKEGRITDMIFLANTMLDVEMPSSEFSRQWIKKHGDEKLNRSGPP